MVDDVTGTRYPNSGRFLEVEPPARIVWSDDGFPDGTGKGTATVTFTRSTTRRPGSPCTSSADFTETIRAAPEVGWGTQLDKLVDFLAAAQA